MRFLVTGGAGFIGSGFVRFLLDERPDVEVVNLDLLTYAGDLDNLEGARTDPRHRFIHGDICDRETVRTALEGVDVVFNLAAESHVDRSIEADSAFVRTNVLGTAVLLSAALEAGVPRFVQVSTDEVYGELPWLDPAEAHPEAPKFTELTPLTPRSPYSATKAGADHLVLAYHETHGMDVVITRCSNNYGSHQHREKLIPLMITRALTGEPLPVYGDGLNVRDWIHVDDHCRGLLAAAERGGAGQVYNLGGDAERTNITVVRTILQLLDRPTSLIEHVRDRPGHDRRYAVDHAKATRELGWQPTVVFEDGLARTVSWYADRMRAPEVHPGGS